MTAQAGGELPDDLGRAVEAFAAHGTILVALDFDGVLAPLVRDPGQSRPLPESAAALRELVGLPGVHVALVSGRHLAELRERAEPPEGVTLVGSHGAEMDEPHRDDETSVLDDAARSLLAEVVEGLGAVVASHEGTALERKPTAAVLHTRQADADTAEQATAAALTGPATLSGVHALRGKQVVELSVVDADKGTAVRTLRGRSGADAVLYAGDDTTDEHAFAVMEGADVGVKVGDGDTRARWRVAAPEDVARLLTRLVELRR